MSVHTLQLRSPPDNIDSIHNLLETAWTDAPGVSPAHRFSFETALIELVSNVFRHADDGSGVTCTLCLQVTSDLLDATVRDDGTPMPDGLVPSDHTPADERVPMPEALAESGRGLPLIRALVDVFGYNRNGDYNEWHIVRRLDA